MFLPCSGHNPDTFIGNAERTAERIPEKIGVESEMAVSKTTGIVDVILFVHDNHG